MNLVDEYMYRPYVQSIVTESPYLIALYDYSRVRVVEENGSWQMPNMQTYASSVEYLACSLLHLPSTVPAMPLDGGRGFKKVIREYKARIKKAQKLYERV